MSLLDAFIRAYQAKMEEETVEFDVGLIGVIARSKHLLLGEAFSPSPDMRIRLNQLEVRAKEPMKVAVTGQFSSGKSTFLNALLSRNILPTGITPVTSKVNYIRYGDELNIRVHYRDGRDEYRSVEEIARFTDQRGEVEDIEHLTLYAPLEMLRDITFVDTPGLNSQDSRDTTTTQRVLNEVDGIIWLSLIDNAGKMSEAETLQKYLDRYRDKSLCVLNQKDKFSPEQVEQTTEHIRQSFSAFFSEVIPISARQALDARSHDKALLMEEALDHFFSTLSEKIASDTIETVDPLYQEYRSSVSQILSRDLSDNQALLDESNLQKVLDFIEVHIRPASQSAKVYAITKEIIQICHKVIQQHQLFLRVYEELSTELVEFEREAEAMLSGLKERFGKSLGDAYSRVEEIIDVIADDIYGHIGTQMRVRYAEKASGFIHKSVTYEPVEYTVPRIDSEGAYRHLFYEDDVVGKMFKRYVKRLKEIQNEVNENNAEVYTMLKKRIRKWQGPYEMLRKNDPLHSYLEFANIRKFASKAYENILKPFSDEIHRSYAQISSEFNHLSSAVSFNYQNATQVSIAFLEQKIAHSVAAYERDPTQFTLYIPKREEIKERLEISFHLYELQNMMYTQNTFLHKNYDRLMREFKSINEERLNLIAQKKERHLRLIAMLERHIDEVAGSQEDETETLIR